MLFPSDVEPGIIMDIIQKGCFKHIYGGKLYGINITSHVLWLALIIPKRMNPSLVRPSLTLQEPNAN